MLENIQKSFKKSLSDDLGFYVIFAMKINSHLEEVQRSLLEAATICKINTEIFNFGKTKLAEIF